MLTPIKCCSNGQQEEFAWKWAEAFWLFLSPSAVYGLFTVSYSVVYNVSQLTARNIWAVALTEAQGRWRRCSFIEPAETHHGVFPVVSYVVVDDACMFSGFYEYFIPDIFIWWCWWQWEPHCTASQPDRNKHLYWFVLPGWIYAGALWEVCVTNYCFIHPAKCQLLRVQCNYENESINVTHGLWGGKWVEGSLQLQHQCLS